MSLMFTTEVTWAGAVVEGDYITTRSRVESVERRGDVVTMTLANGDVVIRHAESPVLIGARRTAGDGSEQDAP